MKVDTIESIANKVERQPNHSPYRSLEKALDILGLFSNFPVLTVTGISSKLGYPKSTISGLLKTFCRYDLIEKDKNGSFRLGIKAFELGFRYFNSMEMHTVVRLWARKLSEETGEPVHAAIRRGMNIYIVFDIQPPDSYMSVLKTGMIVPAHSTALGKMLISSLSANELDVFLKTPLEKFTEYTITESDKLREELNRIKRMGYAIDKEESLKGLICIAVPVFYRDGSVIAAISISSMKLTDNEIGTQTLIRKLKAVAGSISMDMGYQPVKGFGNYI